MTVPLYLLLLSGAATSIQGGLGASRRVSWQHGSEVTPGLCPPVPSACCLGAQLPVCTGTGVNGTLRRLYSAPLTLTYKALSDLGPLTRQASSQSWGCSHPGPGNQLLSQPRVYDNCYLFLEGSAPGPTQGGSFSPLRPQTQRLLHVQAFPDPLRETNGFLLSPSLLYFILFISFPHRF